MPKIEEYSQQTEAEGPVSGTTPILDQVNKAGTGIEDFGRDIEDVGTTIERREVQAETTEASESVSGLRADYTNQINDQINKGTLDTDKFLKSFDQDAQDQRESLTTPGAQNLYDKQTARVRGTLLLKAAHGQAQIAQANAMASENTRVNKNTDTIQADPAQYDSVADEEKSHLDELVSQGTLSAKVAAQRLNDNLKKYALSSLQGQIESDYSSAISEAQTTIDKSGPNSVPNGKVLAEGIKSFTTAQQVMDSGKFDDGILSAKDKAMVLKQQTQSQNAAYTEITRMVAEKKGQQQQNSDNWIGQKFPGIATGQVSSADILKAPIPWEQKNTLLNILKKSSEDQIGDPQKFMDTRNKILNGQVNDVNTIMQTPGLSTKQMESLRTYVDQSPQGQALNANRKAILSYANTELNPGGVMGKSGAGVEKVNFFAQQLQAKEAEYRAAGKDVAPLFQVGGKDYFASQQNMSQYRMNPTDALAARAAKQMSFRPAFPDPAQTTPNVGVNLNPIYNQPNPYEPPQDAPKDKDSLSYAKQFNLKYEDADRIIKARKAKASK